MVYAISYDLRQPDRDYEPLYEEIKKSGAWWHYLESTWLVSTSESVRDLSKRLVQHIDDDDSLLVIEVGRRRQGWLPKKAWEWMNQHLDE